MAGKNENVAEGTDTTPPRMPQQAPPSYQQTPPPPFATHQDVWGIIDQAIPHKRLVTQEELDAKVAQKLGAAAFDFEAKAKAVIDKAVEEKVMAERNKLLVQQPLFNGTNTRRLQLGAIAGGGIVVGLTVKPALRKLGILKPSQV